MSDFTHHFTSLDDIQLHHLEWNGSGTPIIYIPGFIANAYGAIKLAEAISPPRRVLALDLRGRGLSDKPRQQYGLDVHLRDIQSWLDKRNLQRIVLAGHSFGAALSVLFTAQHPERVEKLILLDGGAPPSDLAMQMFRAYHENLTYEYDSIEAYIAPYRKMLTLQPWTDAAETLVFANVQENSSGKAERVVPKHVVEAELESLDEEKWRSIPDVYAQIQVPTLLFRAGMGAFGKEDQHIHDATVALMQAQFPDLRVCDIPNTGHTGILTIDSPERDAACRDFLGIDHNS